MTRAQGGSEVFGQIYSSHSWGGGSRSGPGSDAERAKPYLTYLQSLMDSESQLQSIVDIGCGDWALSRTINWGTRNYLGIDVVPELIETLRGKFARAGSPGTTAGSVSFECRNFQTDDIPSGDLLISKDVLQHLPLAAVRKFLADILPRFRMAIITNDCFRYHYKFWPLTVAPTKVGEANGEIDAGGWRPLRLLEPPFSLRAEEILRYTAPVSRRTVDEKQVLLWRR